MGHNWADDCTHIGFGLVRFTDRKLSTRKGEVIFLEDLLKESIDKTLEIINEKEFRARKQKKKRLKKNRNWCSYIYLS